MRIHIAMVCLIATASAQEVRRALPAGGNPQLDMQAKFLAGYPLPPEDPLARLQSSTSGRSHAATFENLWARYNEHRFIPMRQWSAAELASKVPMRLPVFYFFGGPDAISAMALFPDAPDYILGGLEPVGGLPPPATLPPERLKASLDNLRNSTDVILSFGHFITKEMKADLEATDFRGVVPVIMAFVAMTGGEVLDVTYFSIDSAGAVHEPAPPAGTRGMLPGVRITFRRDPASAPQRIHYVQANVADDSTASRNAVLKWASGFGRGNVYLKAASYLMHESSFSGIRSFLLSQAESVLQDDSGIPFSFFRTADWRCWFFGNYTGTLDIFKRYFQKDLDQAYRSGSTPLPFGTGYKWKEGESNLLLAVRQLPPKAEPIRPAGPMGLASPTGPVSRPVIPTGPAAEEGPAVITAPPY